MLSDHPCGERRELPGKDSSFVRPTPCTRQRAHAPRLDEALQPLVDSLVEDANAALLVLSDHALSMYEHGMRCEAPWEGCLRGFSMLTVPENRRGTIHDHPVSLAMVPHVLMHLAGVQRIDWRLRMPSDALTVCLAPSSLCRANVEPATPAFEMPCMWARAVVRVDDRVYAVVYWWSVLDMARATEASGYSRTALLTEDGLISADRVASQTMWRLPLDGPTAVYDTTVDSTEMRSLSTDEWIESEEGRLVMDAAKRVVDECGLGVRCASCFGESRVDPDEVPMVACSGPP